MSFPADLLYTESHEWVRVEGGIATVGITEHAQDSLGELVHVELPEVGLELEAGEEACEVESTKAVSPIYAPITGAVNGTNDALESSPEMVNDDPYGEGWLFMMSIHDADELGKLLDAKAYAAIVDA
ncbi:MAG: glycine cleavage system protein GcvH [Alphaproteobacteria bacterium]|nr:glycine cleavage system protein GcvH [Alphaproteobacteria bacterium]